MNFARYNGHFGKTFWKQNRGEMLGDKLMNCNFHH